MANALGSVYMTFNTSADGETTQIVAVENERCVILCVGPTLGALFTLPAVSIGTDPKTVYQLSCGPNSLVNARTTPLMEPTINIFLKNTSNKSNITSAIEKETLNTKFLLAIVPVTLGKPVSYKPSNPKPIALKEQKKRAYFTISVEQWPAHAV